jgi:hypothetical protein
VASGQACQVKLSAGTATPMPISLLAISTSTVGSCWTTGAGASGFFSSSLPTRNAAAPPAASATPSTRTRAAFITLHSLCYGTGRRYEPSFTQLMRPRSAGAEPSRISAVKGQFVVNGACLNAVKNVLSEKSRGRAKAYALLNEIGAEERPGGWCRDASRPASRACRDRSAAPQPRARCHRARRRRFCAGASPSPARRAPPEAVFA